LVFPRELGLLARRGLNAAEIGEIVHLAQLCNQHEGLDVKLIWTMLRDRPADQLNDFLYYSDGQLVGFLALFIFNARDAEVSGMVHPAYRQQGIFSRVFEAACEECRSRGLSSLLLIVERVSSAGQAFAAKRSATYDHSEYKMVLTEPHEFNIVSDNLQFRAAAPADASTLANITAQAFTMPENEVDWYTEQALSQPANRRYYVGEIDGRVIGKIDVDLSEEAGFIYGFAVLPQYQGHGYGRRILTHTVHQILSAGQQNVCLEVATENKQALLLYQSSGFTVTASYDYYRFPLYG
jgi:ribosomal protein S18 acetylase RimI-like enzyme